MASADTNFVASFLQDICLSQYESRFLSQGFERFIDIALINEQDLDTLDIKQEDKIKIIEAGKLIV